MATLHQCKPSSARMAEIFKMHEEKKKAQIVSLSLRLLTDDKKLQLETATRLRLHLQKAPDPFISEVISSAEVVSTLLKLIQGDDYPQLQFEAAWIVTNIAAGNSEHVECLIGYGAIPILVRLLSSSDGEIVELAAWALGNIAGDSPSYRDRVLSHQALEHLVAIASGADFAAHRTISWALSNFCRGKPPPQFEQAKHALPALAFLLNSKDVEVLTNACRALSYLSGGTKDKIQAVIDAGICQRLVELLFYPSISVLIPTLRAIGNISTGDDTQTQVIIKDQSLECLLNLLTHDLGKSIKKEACWIISNITAGNCVQIQAVIKAGIFPPLIQVPDDIKKEAAWAISNATSGGTNEQIKYLVSHGCIKFLCDLLLSPDPVIILVCLEGLENILKVAEVGRNFVNAYALLIEEVEGLEKIENLQCHDNNEIYEKAVKILETYWCVDVMTETTHAGIIF